jgi:hypothetical protein
MPAAGPILHIDWLNENSQRRYPLSEEAGLLDTTGSFRIPHEFLVDLIFPVHADPSIDPSKFHVIGIGIFGSGVTVSLGYDGSVIGSVSIDAVTFARNNSYFIHGSGDFADTVGKIVVGSLEEVLKSAGSFQFSLSNGRLESTVIKPDIRGVSALYVKNGEDVSDAIQDDIVLQAGRNFLINYVTGPGAEPNRIVLSAIDGAGLNDDCDCNENADLPCVKTINGVAPDGSGDFTLLGDDCLELQAIANGIELLEKCAKPCCGCDELEIVNTALNQVSSQVFSLEELASRLETSMNALETQLLSSKSGTTQ